MSRASSLSAKPARAKVDGSTIEVFINDAAAYAVRSYPSLPASTLARISAAGDQPLQAKVRVWPLRQATR